MDHDEFQFSCIIASRWTTGHRLEGVVSHTSEEILYFTFESFLWCVNGHIITSPELDQLHSMVSGPDYIVPLPPRSKPDQWGGVHSPFSSVLLFYLEPANAATLLLHELEIKTAFPKHSRGPTPSFAAQNERPYEHAALDELRKKGALPLLRSCSSTSVHLTQLQSWSG